MSAGFEGSAFRSGQARFGAGDRVRADVELCQDGSFPDPAIRVGEVLVAQGCAGQVVDVGVYLGEHIVYAVMFDTGRVVGCLDHELELIAAEGSTAPESTTTGLARSAATTGTARSATTTGTARSATTTEEARPA